MATDIHDVYTGKMQGIDPAQLQQIAQAKAAQSRLSGMNNSPSMQAALRDYKTPQAKMQGSGMASTAPSIFEVLGGVAMRDKGNKSLNAMESQAEALRGKITEGSIAEQTSQLQAADYAQKVKADAANLARTNRTADQIATETRGATRQDTVAAKKRTRVPFHDPVDPSKTLNLEQDGMGNWFRGGEPIESSFVENLTPYKAAQTGSVGYKEKKLAQDKEVALQETILELDLAGGVITDPNLHSATGTLDPVAMLSQIGQFGFEDEQTTATNAQALGLKGAAPILAFLGKPTDRDLEEAFKAVPNPKKEPKVFLDWYENTYSPRVLSAFQNSDRKDMVPQLKAQIEETLRKGYSVQYPEQYLKRYPEHAAKEQQSKTAAVQKNAGRLAELRAKRDAGTLDAAN